MANLVRSRNAGSRKAKVGRSRKGRARLALRHTERRVRRDWNRRGARPLRFSRLRAALSILEKRDDGHHVVSYDPTERDAEGSPRRAQRRSPRGREEPRQTRGRRVMREGEEDLDEVVRTSRRRAMKTESMAEGDVDKIQIEVGAVKALEARHGVARGMFWVTALSLLLWWIPVLGPAVAGYIGGRKAGSPMRAAIATVIPLTILFTALTVFAASTSTVPALVRHLVQSGANGVLGTLPFDFPIIGYVFGNLGAVLNSGPDALFSVLAFALAGGAMTQMRIQERMVPPITARIPASRVVAPMVQAPARALSGRHQAEIDDLMARMNDVLDRAQKERGASGRTRSRGVAGESWQPRRSPFGWLRLPLRRSGPNYGVLQAGENEGAGPLDAASRQVVSDFLAKTPPGKGERRPRALKAPEIDFDLPQTIAFAAPSHSVGAEGRTSAHHYRPSKLYHIYGGSVNPVARAKLEKRLRRTHTLHVMRRGARSLADMVEVEQDGPTPHYLADPDPADKPRSLEAPALAATSTMHYDALEHLENASLETPRKVALRSKAGEEDLGGIIAHLGEGGEAVVEERGIEDVEFDRAPVFDRRGRQRARIGGEEAVEVAPAPHAHAAPGVKPMAAAPAVVGEAIHSGGHGAQKHPTAPKTTVAKSADRSHMTPAQEEKVSRWLKRTIESAESRANAPSPKAKVEVVVEVPHDEPAKSARHAKEEQAPAEAPKPGPHAQKQSAPRRPKADDVATAFEITHGSTEVDAEAATSDGENAAPRKNRSASDILREIRLQRKAEKDAEPGEEIARTANRAKGEADEIERHLREGAGEPAQGEVSLSAHGTAKEAPAKAAKKRPHGEDLEEVETDAEKLSSELELTLAPIREEGVSIVEVDQEPVQTAAPPSAAIIPMVGEDGAVVHITEVVAAPEAHARAVAPEPERDVQQGDVVLAGPSTDSPPGDRAEAELSPLDEERIRKRLQEGWNRM
jgi:hypothetical protein